MSGDMKWWGGGERVVIALIFIIFNKEGGHMLHMAWKCGGRGGSNL